MTHSEYQCITSAVVDQTLFAYDGRFGDLDWELVGENAPMSDKLPACYEYPASSADGVRLENQQLSSGHTVCTEFLQRWRCEKTLRPGPIPTEPEGMYWSLEKDLSK
jgi:hypothetical protein